MLRRVWPRWRDVLVLVQPATVDRWHRDRCVRRWWRRSRRPGRPRIDSRCRELIGRLAEENRLWGAPRIHGELLKLGVVVSERTVSRYLRERPKRPSQTWRTFFANHIGQLDFNTEVLSPDVSGDDLVDGSPSLCRPIVSDRPTVARQHVALDGRASARRPGLGFLCTQDLLRDRTGMRQSTGPRAAENWSRPTARSIRPVHTGQTATGDESETVARHRPRPEPATSDSSADIVWSATATTVWLNRGRLEYWRGSGSAVTGLQGRRAASQVSSPTIPWYPHLNATVITSQSGL
jgi:hypothetical protein